MIRLIIADDHPVIIDGLKTILEKQEEISLVAEVHNGVELLSLLRRRKADVILMDVNMPEVNGIDATRLVKKQYPKIKVLAFSQYDEKRFVKQILKSGANGYLLKNSAASEIIYAIRYVHDGGLFLSSELPSIFSKSDPKKRSSYFMPDLSKRETEVLRQIYLEKNTQEIAGQLGISPHTVETHRSKLLLKVGVKNTAGLMKWAIENEIV
ncbi:MAG: response regulator transcription factor [Bacteroidales bacterium]|nr:response regulator transcription factor [Bacteroidales bacterium]